MHSVERNSAEKQVKMPVIFSNHDDTINNNNISSSFHLKDKKISDMSRWYIMSNSL